MILGAEDIDKAKQIEIEEFAPFLIREGKLWAPAYMRGKWKILTLDMEVARKGAWNVFTLAGECKNVIPYFRGAVRQGKGKI